MSDRYDVAIVGSGPAGLSAAAHASELGLSHVLLEKTDHLSDTIYKYQKKKHVMATPNQLLLRSDVDFDAGKREDILRVWDETIAKANVNALVNADVVAITGVKGDFTLTVKGAANKWNLPRESGSPDPSNAPPPGAATSREIKAGTVILAIGTQGNPNLVRCPVGDGAQVQYQLDDPGEYIDEHITVIGGGDAGIENALGLAAEAAQRNTVSLINRSADFGTAKGPNIKLLLEAEKEGRISVYRETTASQIDKGELVLDTRDGEVKIPCNRVIARMGSAPPRAFVQACGGEFEKVVEEKDGKSREVTKQKKGTGVIFASEERVSYPKLSPIFESTVPGIYVIGALAGYPLIKHCMNQGYDVAEFIKGNFDLKPADEPILEAKFRDLPGGRSVDDWLEYLRANVTILNGMSPLQMREFMLDSDVRLFRRGETIFERGGLEDSLFGIADGSVSVQIDAKDPSVTVPIGTGSMFGEVGLISGRPRGATIAAAEDTVAVEIPRNAALKLQSQVPAAKKEITRIATERQLLQMFRAGLASEDLVEVLEEAEIETISAGKSVIKEGETGDDIYVIRSGSMVVEKTVGGKPVFLSYLPAGSFVGEMALLGGGRRSATVRAAVKSEVIKLKGESFVRLLDAKPGLKEQISQQMAKRQDVNSYIESRQDSFSGVVDMYSGISNFLVEQGVGEATDVLLIDENLCVGCDNCEKACADSHDGLSRLDREAGRTYAHLHVPTSCRHCEHPHCMADCPPNAIHRGPDGEVYIDETCIGCGNCQRNCPYGVIRMDAVPPKKPGLLSWLFLGLGPGPGEPGKKWVYANKDPAVETPKKAIKCDMCAGIKGGPACVRACPTGAAIRVAPEDFLSVARLEREEV